MEPIEMTRAEYEAKYGQSPSVSVAPETKPLTFGERARMSFGNVEELKRREAEAGLRGVREIGDIADIAGAAIPFITSGIGGAIGSAVPGIGTAAGIAGGTALGEMAKRAIGHAFGVREETFGQEVIETGVSTALSYSLTKAGQAIIKLPIVQSFKNWAINYMPERAYKTFFEVSKKDLAQMWKTTELVRLQKEAPEIFDTYIKNGTIKMVNGSPEVNPTLAREVLERGIWGSPEKMGSYAYAKQLGLENQVKNQVKKAIITLGSDVKRGAIAFLKDFSKWQGEMSYKPTSTYFNLGKAKELMTRLQKAGNKVPADLVLEIRRFADDLVNYSPLRRSTKLADKYIPIKEVADDMRGALLKLEGFGDTMNEYRIAIEAFNSMVDYAYRAEKTKIVSMADALIGGGGLVAGGPGVGIGAMTLFRLAQMPFSQTGIAQLLFKGGKLGERAAPYFAAPIVESAKKLEERFTSFR